MSLSGNASMTVKDAIWVCVGNFVYKFNKDGSMAAKTKTKVAARFPICLTNRYVVISSDLGAIHVFDRKSMEEVGKFILRKTNTPPVFFEDDKVVWVCKNECSIIDLNTMIVSSAKLDKPLTTSLLGRGLVDGPTATDPCIVGEDLLFGDNSGSLVKVNLRSLETDHLDLHDSTIWKPFQVGDSVVLVSQSHLYKVEV